MSVTESDLYIPALRIASEMQDGCVETTELITRLEKIFNPQGKDAEILSGRNDTRFSQKVRNIVSHRGSRNNMIAKGFAEYDEAQNRICITAKGRDFLKQVQD